ncbi:MAG: hypothetical protein M1830_009347 [Pleopsidium flavum]|nr:MAG: hypothetical protein M1830_009347 [Pleopsidium flavum]
MRLCARVLACTCVKKDYSCILAVSLLLACIVIVFERGSGGGGTPPDDNDDDADAMQLDSLAATSSAGQAAIATDGQPRFSFGSFQLDVEDERKLKREIVLLQIQKVEGLVAGFQEMVRRGDRAEDTIEGKAWEALGEVFGRKAGRLRSSWERKGRA